MTLRLLLVRHGETEWNVQRRYQGQTDVALSPKGILQAEALALRLSAESIDAAFASDLQRAWLTGQIVTQGREIALTPEPRMREMHFGMLEGLTFDEAQSQHADVIRAWLDNENQPPPGGEDLVGFSRRVKSVLEELQRNHASQTVLLVAHGGPLSEMARLMLGLSHGLRWSFLMDNAGLSEVRLDGGFPFIKTWNDTSHLNS